MNTKDSAPGPDGIPYAFWQGFPADSAAAMLEPQAAIMNIQDALDNPQPRAAILAHLSERVNPFGASLSLSGVDPRFGFVPTLSTFFWSHAQSSGVGSCPLGQGVDMGRAFSVFVFCVAIDHESFEQRLQWCRLGAAPAVRRPVRFEKGERQSR